MESIYGRCKFYFITLIRLLFSLLKGGEHCVICGRKTILVPLCKKCQNEHFKIEPETKRCSCCGKTLISTKDTCLECRTNPVFSSSDYALPLYSYRLWNKELLFLWKIGNVRTLSYFFAGKISKALNKMGVKVIVPVPPRKGKIAKNGWDQIDELCYLLKVFYGFSVLKLLERNSEKQQKKLNREERIDTIGAAYRLKNSEGIKKALKSIGGNLPEEVCIIDDVCTTGSTLECCSKLIKMYGIKRVGVMSLFIVD